MDVDDRVLQEAQVGHGWAWIAIPFWPLQQSLSLVHLHNPLQARTHLGLRQSIKCRTNSLYHSLVVSPFPTVLCIFIAKVELNLRWSGHNCLLNAYSSTLHQALRVCLEYIDGNSLGCPTSHYKYHDRSSGYSFVEWWLHSMSRWLEYQTPIMRRTHSKDRKQSTCNKLLIIASSQTPRR